MFIRKNFYFSIFFHGSSRITQRWYFSGIEKTSDLNKSVWQLSAMKFKSYIWLAHGWLHFYIQLPGWSRGTPLFMLRRIWNFSYFCVMKKSSNTEQRVAHILKEMSKALPEIKRQVQVYERSLKSGASIKSPKVTVHSRNVWAYPSSCCRLQRIWKMFFF